MAIIIVFRLLWQLRGERQLGLGRFYPVFEGLNASNFPVHPAIGKKLILGIALSLIGATVTGIVLVRGRSVGVIAIPDKVSEPLFTNNNEIKYDKRVHRRERRKEYRERQDSFIDEIHEFFANLMMILVAMHITYMVLLKWPIAKFMCSFQKMSQPGSDSPK